MKLTLKNYKLIKIKQLIKKKKLIIFCNFINDISKKFIKLNQIISKKKVKFFKINSFLTHFLVRNSIYLNLKNINLGSIAILHFNKLKLFYEFIFSLLNANINQLYFFCCMFNKKLYNIKLILNLKTLKFVTNIKLLYFYFKRSMYITFLSCFFVINKKRISK